MRLFKVAFRGLVAVTGASWLLMSCENHNLDQVKPGPKPAPPGVGQTPTTPLNINLSQTWGTPGTSFIIEGGVFDAKPENNKVKLGTTGLQVVSSTKNQIVVLISPDSTYTYGSFAVTVKANGQVFTSEQNFTLDHAFGEAYTDKLSYNPGDKLVAYLSTPQNTSTNIVGIYDINHNLVFSVPSSVTHQNVSTTSPSSDGFGWSPTFEVPLPNDLKSGIYLIENRFPFVVKSTIPTDIVVVFPFNTENAYNESGGKSLYSHADRPFQVSFLRPISIPNKAPVLDFVEDGLQWFTTQTDFSIGYITDQDLDNYDYLQNSKLLILTGHSEYWTRTARENFDKFIDNNGDALILSGNVMWWQVRYSDDKSKLICYKDLPDPVADPLLKTIKWTEPSLNYPITLSIGADYAHGGYGYKADQGWDGYKIVSPNSPLLQGTGLKKGDIIKLPTIEYDGAVLKGMDRSGYPILDETHYNFFKMEIIGFDRGSSSSGETIATFLAFQRTPTSGKVVHTATTNWCSYEGIGGTDQNVIRLITKNAITKLLQDQNIFSY